MDLFGHGFSAAVTPIWVRGFCTAADASCPQQVCCPAPTWTWPAHCPHGLPFPWVCPQCPFGTCLQCVRSHFSVMFLVTSKSALRSTFAHSEYSWNAPLNWVELNWHFIGSQIPYFLPCLAHQAALHPHDLLPEVSSVSSSSGDQLSRSPPTRPQLLLQFRPCLWDTTLTEYALY